jgi:ABC-type multidrug transport system fused ATPase/permease subunit
MLKLQREKLYRLLRYLRPYLAQETEIVACMVIGILLSLIDPLIIKVIIDDVLVDKNLSLLNTLIIAFLALFFFRGVFRVISSYLYSYVGQSILYDIRNQLFQHLQKLHLGFFASQKTGEILSRVNSDISAIQRMTTETVLSVITDFITVIGIVVILLILDWRLTLICLAVMPLFVIVITTFSQRIRKQSRRVREKVADITSFFQEIFSGIQLVQSFGQERYEADRLEQKGHEIIDMRLRLTLMGSVSVALMGFIVALGPLAVLWFGGRSVINDAMGLGTLVAFYAYIGRLFSPVYRLAQLNVEVQSSLASVDRIFEYLDIEPMIQDRPEAITLEKVKGKVAFQNVSFSYDSGKEILRDVSFQVDPGQSIALVGPIGTGKTTIINLICRFYEPQKGTVFIDGYDVKDITLASLRKSIGIVSQDPVLFHSSIKENLKYANLDASDEQIVLAAKRAHIHDFIEMFPQGYETVVGDRGVRLSGGQRQCIAIARAILKDPRILILDEATAFVDAESAASIRQSLKTLVKERTVFIIAHNFSTVKDVDKILVISDHSIVGEGKHEDLYETCGIYRRLYDTQMSTKIEANSLIQ